MKRLYLSDMETLAAFMVSQASERKTVTAVFHYKEAAELLHELAKYDDVNITSVWLEPEDWDLYTKEFYITLSGKLNMELDVERAYNPKCNRYIQYESDCVVLGGDSCSNIMTNNCLDSATFYEAVFSDEEIECEDCELCAGQRRCGGFCQKSGEDYDDDPSFFEYLFGLFI